MAHTGGKVSGNSNPVTSAPIPALAALRAIATTAPPPTTAEVFRQSAGFAWRVLRRLGVPDADADDVLQDVFVTVHRKLPGFEGRSSVRTWLYGICIRVAADYRIRARGRREAPSEALELAVEPGQEAHLATAQARVLLDRVLDTLDDAKRAVFVLHEIEELPMSEIATALECPLQTAYSRLHAARRQVEAAVAELQKRGQSP
jgi:RNA polymerase sigma-70 factor (ECF subfamily)